MLGLVMQGIKVFRTFEGEVFLIELAEVQKTGLHIL